VTRRNAGTMTSLVMVRLMVPVAARTFRTFSVLTTSLMTMTTHFSSTAEEVNTSQEALRSVLTVRLKASTCRNLTLVTLMVSTDRIVRSSRDSTGSFTSSINRCIVQLIMQHIVKALHFISSPQVFNSLSVIGGPGRLVPKCYSVFVVVSSLRVQKSPS